MELVSVFPVSLGRELAILLLSVSQDTGFAPFQAIWKDPQECTFPICGILKVCCVAGISANVSMGSQCSLVPTGTTKWVVPGLVSTMSVRSSACHESHCYTESS